MMIKQVSVQANGTPENKVCSLLMINIAKLMCYHYNYFEQDKESHTLSISCVPFFAVVDDSDSEPKDDGGANRELSVEQTNASTDCVSRQNGLVGGSTAPVL